MKLILLVAVASLAQLASCVPYTDNGQPIYSGNIQYKPVRTEVSTTYYEPTSPTRGQYVENGPQSPYRNSQRVDRMESYPESSGYNNQQVVYRGEQPVYVNQPMRSTSENYRGEPVYSSQASSVRERPQQQVAYTNVNPSEPAGYDQDVYIGEQLPNGIHYNSNRNNNINYAESPSRQEARVKKSKPQNYPKVKAETFYVADEQNHNDIDFRADSAIKKLRSTLANDFTNLSNDKFDQYDIDDIMRGSDRFLLRYLNQRNFDLAQTRELILNVLHWRKRFAINQLYGRQHACDLFNSGLIFEQKLTQTKKESAKAVIWIRLGALGEAIKTLKENGHFSKRKALSSEMNMAKQTVKKLVEVGKKNIGKKAHEHKEIGQPMLDDKQPDPRSLINDSSLQFILHSIAWWINDWDHHHPTSKATLVLDFENSNGAFSSSSIGSFLIQLDDRFPDLFDQIIAFRYAPPLTWSLREKVGMLNRLFLSRVAASDKTNTKIKFVGHKDEVEKYISDQRFKGMNDIPEHVLKTCTRRSYPLPEACPVNYRSSFADQVVNINENVINSIKEQLVRC